MLFLFFDIRSKRWTDSSDESRSLNPPTDIWSPPLEPQGRPLEPLQLLLLLLMVEVEVAVVGMTMDKEVHKEVHMEVVITSVNVVRVHDSNVSVT
jgi:hypothetical protein